MKIHVKIDATEASQADGVDTTWYAGFIDISFDGGAVQKLRIDGETDRGCDTPCDQIGEALTKHFVDAGLLAPIDVEAEEDDGNYVLDNLEDDMRNVAFELDSLGDVTEGDLTVTLEGGVFAGVVFKADWVDTTPVPAPELKIAPMELVMLDWALGIASQREDLTILFSKESYNNLRTRVYAALNAKM